MNKCKCKALTKNNIHCRYDAVLEGYCMMHWKLMHERKEKEKLMEDQNDK